MDSGPGPGRELPRRWMTILVVSVRACFIGYLIALTALLLTRDPTRLVGAPPTPLEAVVHLLSFTLLAFLAMAARWPGAVWGVVLLLAAYAAGTELLQGLVSGRTPEWGDWFQDVVGIAVGVALHRCWTVVWHRLAGPSDRRAKSRSARQEAGRGGDSID